jgi:hypothetical protein
MTFNVLVYKPSHDGPGLRERDGERAEQRERESRERGAGRTALKT